MATRTRLGLLVLAAGLAVGAPARPRAQAQTADDIVARYLQAIGGADALGKLTTRRATGTASVSTPGGDVSGPLESLYKAPNKSRLSISLDLSAMGAGQVSVIQRFDGTAGMMSNSMQGDTEITGSMLEHMRNDLFPTPFLHYKESGVTLELLPKETIDGHPTLVIQTKPKSGPTEKYYFSPDTYLLVGTDVVVNSPQFNGDVEEISNLSDYRDVSGVKVPFQVVSFVAGQTLTVTLTKVEHNIPIDDSTFSK